MPSTRPLIATSLATPSASTRRLDRHDVAGGHVARDLRGQRLPVEEIRTGSPRRATAFALRRGRASLADDREPAVLEHAQRATNAVAAGVATRSARAAAKPIALDEQRVLELERLHRRRERVR